MRRRYHRDERGRYPLEPNPGAWSAAVASAALAYDRADQLPTASQMGPQNIVVPLTFDYIAIVAAPASGSTTVLVGDGTNTQGSVQSSPVPLGMKGIVDGIYPYLEGGSGPITSPRIPGAGVTITWQLFVAGRAHAAYGAITTILQPWSAPPTPRALLYIRPGEQLTCSVINTDPGGLYSYVGIRITGRWEPLDNVVPTGAIVPDSQPLAPAVPPSTGIARAGITALNDPAAAIKRATHNAINFAPPRQPTLAEIQRRQMQLMGPEDIDSFLGED